MIHIVCAACRTVIGVLDSEYYADKDADLLAIAHSGCCPATKEEKEQAIFDLKFRDMTGGIGL